MKIKEFVNIWSFFLMFCSFALLLNTLICYGLNELYVKIGYHKNE